MKTINALVNVFSGIVTFPSYLIFHLLIGFVITIIITGYNVEHRKVGDWILTWDDYKQAKLSDESV